MHGTERLNGAAKTKKEPAQTGQTIAKIIIDHREARRRTEDTRGPQRVPQRWLRSSTSLASLMRAAKYVVPPWSGCSFFMSRRCARLISAVLEPGATPRT